MIIAYLAIVVLFFILCMVISCTFKPQTILTAKILASMVLAIAWPVIVLALFILDVKDFFVYLWSKIKK